MHDLFNFNWIKKNTEDLTCKSCGKINTYNEKINNFFTCIYCGHHLKYPIELRIKDLFDNNTFVEYNDKMTPNDFLKFKDKKRYSDRIKENIQKTKYKSAVVTGFGKINGIKIHCSILNFEFMGGSLGSVEGEKILQSIEAAIREKTPLLIISSSGGARMQESSISLMQMAKTSAALKKLSNNGLPYVSLLTNPTMGGVSASFAFLGDLIISEPEALIGFAGKRVIKQTIQSELPFGFQTAEYLLEHGLIDDIIKRDEQRNYLTKVFSILSNKTIKKEEK